MNDAQADKILCVTFMEDSNKTLEIQTDLTV